MREPSFIIVGGNSYSCAILKETIVGVSFEKERALIKTTTADYLIEGDAEEVEALRFWFNRQDVSTNVMAEYTALMAEYKKALTDNRQTTDEQGRPLEEVRPGKWQVAEPTVDPEVWLEDDQAYEQALAIVTAGAEAAAMHERDQNPYAPGSNMAKLWDSGFCEARWCDTGTDALAKVTKLQQDVDRLNRVIASEFKDIDAAYDEKQALIKNGNYYKEALDLVIAGAEAAERGDGDNPYEPGSTLAALWWNGACAASWRMNQ